MLCYVPLTMFFMLGAAIMFSSCVFISCVIQPSRAILYLFRLLLLTFIVEGWLFPGEESMSYYLKQLRFEWKKKNRLETAWITLCRLTLLWRDISTKGFLMEIWLCHAVFNWFAFWSILCIKHRLWLEILLYWHKDLRRIVLDS